MNRLIISAFLCLLAACAAVPIDSSMSADDGNDSTAFVSACGQPLRAGYVFCRAHAGSDPAAVQVTLVVPKVDCKYDACVEFRVIMRDGSLGYGGAIPKGQTQAVFTLKDVLGNEPAVMKAHDGEYLIAVRSFAGLPGSPIEILIKHRAFLRLQVLDASYRTLACGDPVKAYGHAIGKDCDAEWSTAGRTALCGHGCKP